MKTLKWMSVYVVIVRRKLKDPARMYGKLKYKDKDKEDIDFDSLDIDYDKLDLSDELDLKSFFRKDDESFDEED